jgi:hypothetical protein
MATRAKVIAPMDTVGDDVRIVTWTGLTQTTSDDGDPFEMPGWADRTVQVIGTLGAGGSVRIEGSLNGTDYAPLTDPQGNALDVTTLKIESIAELTRYVRPRVTAGDGTTDLSVILLARRT